MCLANPQSAQTLLFASQNLSPRLTSVFRSIILVNVDVFSFVFRVYDACLREQNETKKCKLHLLIASKQLLHRMSLNRRNSQQQKYKGAVNVTKSTQAVPSGIFCFASSLTISYLGEFRGETSSLPNDSIQSLFLTIRVFFLVFLLHISDCK